jgi:hypothetical protein
VDISNKLPEIDILIADNGLISVLKKMAMPTVADIVAYGISGQQSPHK